MSHVVMTMVPPTVRVDTAKSRLTRLTGAVGGYAGTSEVSVWPHSMEHR